MYFEGQVM
jgi:hypothetical protein